MLNAISTSISNYSKDKTYTRLQRIFKPIVKDTMGQVGVTRPFQDINNKLSSIPLADKASVDLDQYVTDKSLDGLFVMLAEEEKKIRQDPAARVTDILKKELHDQAVINCIYSWKSHRQHKRKISEIKKYSKMFFGLVVKKIEGMKFDFHVCEICGSTIDEAPKIPCDIRSYQILYYRKVKRPARGPQ